MNDCYARRQLARYVAAVIVASLWGTTALARGRPPVVTVAPDERWLRPSPRSAALQPR